MDLVTIVFLVFVLVLALFGCGLAAMLPIAAEKAERAARERLSSTPPNERNHS